MSRLRWMACGMAIVLLTGGCSTIRRPEVRGVKPHITSIDLQGVSMVLDVEVNNPYPVRLHVPRFDYAIDIQGQPFIASQAPAETDLPAQQVGTIALPARFGYTELWRTYQALADASEVDYRLRASFPITALGQTYELPVSHSGKLPVLRLPSISFGDVDVSGVSTSGARVSAQATLSNPNVFALGLGDLAYHLRLGEVPVGAVTASTVNTIAPGASGQLNLVGEVTARAALMKLLAGSSLGRPTLVLSGAVQTPYGSVPVAKGP